MNVVATADEILKRVYTAKEASAMETGMNRMMLLACFKVALTLFQKRHLALMKLDSFDQGKELGASHQVPVGALL
jgi:hypothetical protein